MRGPTDSKFHPKKCQPVELIIQNICPLAVINTKHTHAHIQPFSQKLAHLKRAARCPLFWVLESRTLSFLDEKMLRFSRSSSFFLSGKPFLSLSTPSVLGVGAVGGAVVVRPRVGVSVGVRLLLLRVH